MTDLTGSGRRILAWLLVAAAAVMSATLAPSVADAATSTTYTSRTTVNLRTAANTNSTVLTMLDVGQSVIAAGKVSGDWLPVSYDGKTAYAWASYLVKDATPATVVTSGPEGRKKALENINVRAAASMDAEIVKILMKDTVVRVTGFSSGVFNQVTVDGTERWIHSQFLSTTTDTSPEPVAEYLTTADLALRTEASITSTNQGTMKAGTTVSGTGKHSGSYSQVINSGRLGWVITGFLKAAPGTPAEYVLPLTTDKLLVIALGTVLREKADAKSAALATLTLGATMRLTGVAKSGFSEVIWNGATGWVDAKALGKSVPPTADLGSDSLNKLQAFGKTAVLEVRDKFPQIKTIHGWRASSAYSADHPSGRAIDIMIPNYKTNVALGNAIAEYFIANGNRLHVDYIIWRQRNYRLTRGYWVKMSDRGSDTANHMDHVHVSFFDTGS